MPRVAVAGLLVVGAFVGAGAASKRAQRPPAADETVRNSYKSDGLSAEILGTCKITEGTVECWNFDAKPDPELSHRVDVGLRNQSGMPVSYRYGRSNRWIVRQMSRDNGSTRSAQWSDSYSGGNQIPIEIERSNTSVGGWSGERTMQIVPVLADAGPDQFPIRLAITEYVPMPGAKIVPKVGATATAGPITIRIKSIVKPPIPPNGGYPMGDSWLVTADFVSSASKPLTTSISLVAANAKGQPFVGLDGKGHPLTQEEINRSSTRWNGGFSPWAGNRYMQPLTFSSRTFPATLTGIVNFNPSIAPSMLISISTTVSVDFSNPPMEPNH